MIKIFSLFIITFFGNLQPCEWLCGMGTERSFWEPCDSEEDTALSPWYPNDNWMEMSDTKRIQAWVNSLDNTPSPISDQLYESTSEQEEQEKQNEIYKTF